MITRFVAAAAVIVWALVACSGSGPSTPAEDEVPPTSASSHPGQGTTGSAAPTQKESTKQPAPPKPSPSPPPKKRFNLITWITGLGITGAPGPLVKEPIYERLAARDCSGADPDNFPVLAAAMAACRAAMAGRDADSAWWAHAARVRDATDRSTLDCIDAKAYALLDVLVAAHLANPELPFKFDEAGGLGRPACLMMVSFRPHHAVAGDVVTVSGRYLDRAEKVLLHNGDQGQIIQKSAGSLQFRMPAHIETSGYNAIIYWNDNGHQAGSWIPLAYGADENDAPTQSVSPAPTTGPSEPSTAPTRRPPGPESPGGNESGDG